MASSKAETAAPAFREQWAINHNAARKLKYDTDPEHRAQRLQRSRQEYREKAGVELASCLSRIHEIPAYGQIREISNGQNALCLTMAEFGTIIGGHSAPVMHRWRSRGLIPHPAVDAKITIVTTGRAGTYVSSQGVYLADEVHAMMEVIGKHQTELKYYRTRDTNTINAVFAAVGAARANLGI